MARAAHPLEERGNGARGPDLDREVHVANVDAEFERRGRHERAETARLEPLLRVETTRAREAAVVAGDRVLSEPLGEAGRQALRHLSRIDEHERRAVLLDERRQTSVDDVPLLV